MGGQGLTFNRFWWHLGRPVRASSFVFLGFWWHRFCFVLSLIARPVVAEGVVDTSEGAAGHASQTSQLP